MTTRQHPAEGTHRRARSPPLSRLDLNLLVALDALLTERSVTKAAERLHLSQPALSASLARLRTHFNDPILARRGNTYELTPLALRLTEHTTTALEAARRVFESQATWAPQDSTREFSIYGSDYGFATVGTAVSSTRGRARARSALPLHAAQPLDRRRGRDPPALRRRHDDPARPLTDLPYVDLWRDRLGRRRIRLQRARRRRLTMELLGGVALGLHVPDRAPRSPRRRGSCSSSASSRGSRPSSRASSRCRTSSPAPTGSDCIQAGLAPRRTRAGRHPALRAALRCDAGGQRAVVAPGAQRATRSTPGCAACSPRPQPGCRRPATTEVSAEQVSDAEILQVLVELLVVELEGYRTPGRMRRARPRPRRRCRSSSAWPPPGRRGGCRPRSC